MTTSKHDSDVVDGDDITAHAAAAHIGVGGNVQIKTTTMGSGRCSRRSCTNNHPVGRRIRKQRRRRMIVLVIASVVVVVVSFIQILLSQDYVQIYIHVHGLSSVTLTTMRGNIYPNVYRTKTVMVMTATSLYQRRRPSRIILETAVTPSSSTEVEAMASIQKSTSVIDDPQSSGDQVEHEHDGDDKHEAASTTTTSTRRRLKTTSRGSSTHKIRRQRRQRRPWDIMFPRLQQYYKEHGHSNVTSHEDDESDLYEWTQTLRKNYRGQIIRRQLNMDVHKNDDYVVDGVDDANATETTVVSERDVVRRKRRRHELPEWKIQQLEAIEFSWATSIRRSPLLTKIDRIKKYGNSKVSKRKYRIWSTYYPKLVEFYKEHGHTNVTRQNGGDDLFRWTQDIRRRFRRQGNANSLETNSNITSTTRMHGNVLSSIPASDDRSRLSDENLQQLDDVDFHWCYSPVDASDDDENSSWVHNVKSWNEAWFEKYNKLVQFQQEHGHCRPKVRDHPELSYFVNDQRRYYRRRKRGGKQSTPLTDTRIALLEKIGFEWGRTHNERWEERRQDLVQYREENGDTAVPQDFHQDPRLGHWVMNQRTHYRLKEQGKYSTMSQYRISDLESLGFVFNYRQQQTAENWREMFEWAQAYQAEHGNLKISTSDTAHARLRVWLNAQRVYYKRDRAEAALEKDDGDVSDENVNENTHLYRRRRPHLSKDQIEALESIDGFRWKYRLPSKYPSSTDWSKLFDALRDRGITPNAKMKQHWFDGINPLRDEVKSVWTEDELVALWYEDEDDEDDREDYYYEDEDTRNFLRA